MVTDEDRAVGDVRLPHFLVIGAAKAGTTAVYAYLRQHPEIFLPLRQEPSFFAFEGMNLNLAGPHGTEAAVNRYAVTSLTEYAELFRIARSEQVLGDVSPAYLYWPDAARRIRRYIPQARIAVLLRNPADRAYSAYMHAVREGKEPIGDFQEALAAEPQRIAENWGLMWRYRDLGNYVEQLERYYAVFSAERIKVILFDDLVREPLQVCRDLQSFIGVDTEFRPDVSLRHNVSGVPRSRVLQRALRGGAGVRRVARAVAPFVGQQRLRRWQTHLSNQNVRKIPAEALDRKALTESFREEVAELQRLIGRDLSAWLS